MENHNLFKLQKGGVPLPVTEKTEVDIDTNVITVGNSTELYYYKAGRIVFVVGAVLKTAYEIAYADVAVFGTGLPAPIYPVRFSATANSGNCIRMTISKSGNLQSYSCAIAQNENFTFSVAYIAEE